MKKGIWFYLLIIIHVLIFSCNKKNDAVNADINFNPAITYGKMTDQDGNTYKTVTIGTQVWMAENLKTTKCNDNTPIPEVADSSIWISLNTPGYCWYDNDPDANRATYGALYNWHAINTGKLCPMGWHMPSDAEWITLRTYLGGEDLAGGKLKESGTLHWKSPNTGATNESGFTGLPGGVRESAGIGNNGKFGNKGFDGSWWSATRISSEPISPVYGFWIHTDYSRLFRPEFFAGDGINVRCIKD
jgi:uncharacterized protein (TIGR02145 family)